MQIVFQFDIRTNAVFVALTFFVQATAIAQALLIRELKQYRGVLAALLANLCAAASLLLRLGPARSACGRRWERGGFTSSSSS